MRNSTYFNDVTLILGTTRCGKKLLRSLLDGHPELLVWPFEVSFLSFCANQLNKKQIIETKNWIKILKDNLDKVKFNRNLKLENYFDEELFFSLLKKKENFTYVNEFMNFNFDCLKSSLKFYRNKHKLKKIMLVSGIDILNCDIQELKTYKFIHIKRNYYSIFESLKYKSLVKYKNLNSFYSFKKKSFFWWIYIIFKIEKIINLLPNEILILKYENFYDKSYINKIVHFLKISYDPSLTKLNFLTGHGYSNISINTSNKNIDEVAEIPNKNNLNYFDKIIIHFTNFLIK